MLKLLIADDEKIIRETISSIIDWHSLGIEVIGCAGNGIEAYNMILDLYPDIVMTDIRMPGLSGLDLIERMYEINKDTQFIILSGYSEFEYAQKAMQFGVKHYLIKPCSEDQIINCIKEISKNYQEKKFKQNITNENFQLKGQIRTSLLINIINQYLSNIDNISSEFENSFFRDYRKHFNDIDNSYDVFYLYYIEENNKTEAIQKISQFWKEEYPRIWLNILYVKNTMVIFFESFLTNYDKLTDFFNSLHFAQQATTPQLQHCIYFDLKSLLHKITRQIRRYTTILYSDGKTYLTISNYANMLQNIQDCISLAFNPNGESQRSLEPLLSSIAEIKELSFLKQVTPSIILAATSNNYGFNIVKAVDLLILLNSETDIQLFKEKLCEELNKIYWNQSSTSSTDSISERIKRCVSNNISNPQLSLKWIAEKELFMNVDYIGKKFVKETGQKFSSYLTNERIKRAKELLLSDDFDSISEIAKSVGCGNNPVYFSQIFKKATGMSPSAYSKMVREKK